jgi:hypothetical protein
LFNLFIEREQTVSLLPVQIPEGVCRRHLSSPMSVPVLFRGLANSCIMPGHTVFWSTG